MQSPPSLIFDDTISGHRNYDTNSLFTTGIAKLVTKYFREANVIRKQIVKLLGNRYENNYHGFVR
jgi:hypothetical protein